MSLAAAEAALEQFADGDEDDDEADDLERDHDGRGPPDHCCGADIFSLKHESSIFRSFIQP